MTGSEFCSHNQQNLSYLAFVLRRKSCQKVTIASLQSTRRTANILRKRFKKENKRREKNPKTTSFSAHKLCQSQQPQHGGRRKRGDRGRQVCSPLVVSRRCYLTELFTDTSLLYSCFYPSRSSHSPNSLMIISRRTFAHGPVDDPQCLPPRS